VKTFRLLALALSFAAASAACSSAPTESASAEPAALSGPAQGETCCGPRLGMPNYVCADGVTLAGPGACIQEADGRCHWEIKQCSPCDSVSCQAGHHCEVVAQSALNEAAPRDVGVCYADGLGGAGDLCDGEHGCEGDLLCCYPGGIPGLRNRCTAPLAGAWRRGRCPLYPVAPPHGTSN
jgi:hypothetical protein